MKYGNTIVSDVMKLSAKRLGIVGEFNLCEVSTVRPSGKMYLWDSRQNWTSYNTQFLQALLFRDHNH